MAELDIVNNGNVLYVDSRLVAERLGVEHDNFLQTVQGYQTQIEQAFGVLLFETGKPPKGSRGGRPSRYALLTEDQATFVMTLSRNTPEVVQCKIDLVRSFSKAKKLLEGFGLGTDRTSLRGSLKDDARLRVTDQVKDHLEQIRRYDDKKFRGRFFAQVHDAINIAVTGETAAQMRSRLSTTLGRQISESTLIRDYFPAIVLQRYIAMCEVTANLMLAHQCDPLEAVQQAAKLALPHGHFPAPIDFAEHIRDAQPRLMP